MGRPYRDREWLRSKYHDEGSTQREIAEECDVSPRCIRKWMKRFGIERRDPVGENHGLYGKDRSEETKAKISETLEGRSFSEETLRRMSNSHLGNEISEDAKEEIAESLRGLTRPKSTREKMSESRRGEANPMWNGGVWKKSWYDDQTWFRVRAETKERDEVCQHCGHDGTTHTLDVHHLIPIRLFDDDDVSSVRDAHETGNLVLLCRPCHRKAGSGQKRILPDFSSIPVESIARYVRLWTRFLSEKRLDEEGSES